MSKRRKTQKESLLLESENLSDYDIDYDSDITVIFFYYKIFFTFMNRKKILRVNLFFSPVEYDENDFESDDFCENDINC